MIINTEIIDDYINRKSLKNYKNHWIYRSILEGELLIEEPQNVSGFKLEEVYKIVLEKINNFQPINVDLWNEFFGQTEIPDTTCIYLIVGAPKPYDAMVRKDEQGNDCIIFDLLRMSAYSEDTSKFQDIVLSFLTHELAHIIINKRYSRPSIESSLVDNVKYIVFDEGIAHFLSYKGNVLSVNWYSDEMKKRKFSAYGRLKQVLSDKANMDKDKVLMEADSGAFWDKFGAISGLFAIIDFYNYRNRDKDAFKYIFENGPDILSKFILNN